MPSRLAQLIRQEKPFQTLEQEAGLAVQRLAADLAAGLAELLKPAGISGAQYNVLRILRGARDVGLTCGEVAERLVTRDPDVTRLIDRLERQGLVARSRDRADRRVVTLRITEPGLALLADLDAPVLELHQRQLAHLGPERLQALIGLIDEASAGMR